ncbi:MAG: NAD(P)H-dependent oxidoreductase subunit E [Clostridiales bacterium]|nr:NAD(P)H-dependent oxidoreductase subunit E [Clostridiales bacterium]
MSKNCQCGEDKVCQLDNVIKEHKNIAGALIPVLHEAQKIFGYLPMSVQKQISKGLNISLAEIYGVVTFYSEFSTEPKGEYQINVCLGTACYVKGANDILEQFKKQLKIDVGQTTSDNKFSINACRCVGACGLAPVVTINEEVYGKLVADDVKGILEKYQV